MGEPRVGFKNLQTSGFVPLVAGGTKTSPPTRPTPLAIAFLSLALKHVA